MPRRSSRNIQKVAQWKDTDVRSAVATVKQKRMSVEEAAKFFKLPKSTLGDRFTRKIQEYAKMGRPTFIPIEIENELVLNGEESAALLFSDILEKLC